MRTLQKSILFTPRDPKAGPTGGEGEACPAPTISLTIWFVVRALRAIIGVSWRAPVSWGEEGMFLLVTDGGRQGRVKGLGLETRVWILNPSQRIGGRLRFDLEYS